VIFDDKNAIQFLERYFDHRVVQRFHNIKLGAHKADLLRYCFLYVYGGIYIDIKTILIKPLDEIFINKTAFYTCISIKDSISNGIIASKPRNYIFLKLINNIININPDYPESDGLVFCNFLNVNSTFTYVTCDFFFHSVFVDENLK
jgi:mannosyltransferase OCH1-like enzyme